MTFIPSSGGGGAANVFVYRQGGVAAGNVFTTFAAAYAAASAVQGPSVIELDNSLGGLQILAGGYDLSEIELRGLQSNPITGVAVNNHVHFDGFGVSITNLILEMENTSAPITTLTGAGNTFFIRLHNSVLERDSTNQPFISSTLGGTVTLEMINSSFSSYSVLGGGAVPGIVIDSGSILNSTLYNGSSLLNCVTGDGTGSWNSTIDDSSQVQQFPGIPTFASSVISKQFIDQTGTLDLNTGVTPQCSDTTIRGSGFGGPTSTTLWAKPTVMQRVVFRYDFGAGSPPIWTINGDGNNINGAATTTLTLDGQTLELQYVGADGWISVVEPAGGGGLYTVQTGNNADVTVTSTTTHVFIGFEALTAGHQALFPPAPSPGQRFVVADLDGSLATQNITVNPNGMNLDNAAGSFVMTNGNVGPKGTTEWLFVSNAYGWKRL